MLYTSAYNDLRKQIINSKVDETIRLTKKPYGCSPEKLVSSDDAFSIDDIKIMEDGAIYTWMGGRPQPMRVFPDHTTVWVTAYYKRLLRLVATNIMSMGKIKMAISLLALKFNADILPKWFACMFEMNGVLLKDEHYSQPIKELRRLLKGKIDENVMDALTLILEYDLAYRFRFQDAVSEFNKESLWDKSAFINEVCRLFDILSSREYDDKGFSEHQAGFWQKLKKLTRLVLKYSQKTFKMVYEIFFNLKIDEIKFSKEDLYWTNRRDNYNYRGLTPDVRKKENIALYGEELS